MASRSLVSHTFISSAFWNSNIDYKYANSWLRIWWLSTTVAPRQDSSVSDPDPDGSGFFRRSGSGLTRKKNFDQDPEKKLDPKHGKIQKLALKTNLSFFFSIYLNQKKPYIKPKRKIKQTFKELLTTTKQVFLYWMGTFQVKNRRPSPHNVENKFLIKIWETWPRTLVKNTGKHTVHNVSSKIMLHTEASVKNQSFKGTNQSVNRYNMQTSRC